MASKSSSDEQLQCPYSKILPTMYERSSAPCAGTAFKNYSRLNEHIWVYHSYLFSCDLCDNRVSKNYVVGERLEQKKEEHLNKYHRGDTGSKQLLVVKNTAYVMSPKQDSDFKTWTDEERGRRRGNDRYFSLCRTLFGNHIETPDNPTYDFYIPKHLSKPSSRERGERNLAYVEQRLADGGQKQKKASQPILEPPPQNALGVFSPREPGDPLTLISSEETGITPTQWAIPVLADSGYVTYENRDEADYDMEPLQNQYTTEDPSAKQAMPINTDATEPRDMNISNGMSRQDNDLAFHFTGAFDNTPQGNSGYIYPTNVDEWPNYEYPYYSGYAE